MECRYEAKRSGRLNTDADRLFGQARDKASGNPGAFANKLLEGRFFGPYSKNNGTTIRVEADTANWMFRLFCDNVECSERNEKGECPRKKEAINPDVREAVKRAKSILV